VVAVQQYSRKISRGTHARAATKQVQIWGPLHQIIQASTLFEALWLWPANLLSRASETVLGGWRGSSQSSAADVVTKERGERHQTLHEP
jgi:hypothetical protein